MTSKTDEWTCRNRISRPPATTGTTQEVEADLHFQTRAKNCPKTRDVPHRSKGCFFFEKFNNLNGMTNDHPLFSVVIPTRNRASLLRYALRTALEQSFDDFEIVVSNNASNDETASVVRELATTRVRYVQTDHPLSMPDHWEFAFDQARGKFVTYLCDDDALCPAALEKVASAIREQNSDLVVLGTAEYFGSNWLQPTRRNSVTIWPFTRDIIQRQSHETLKILATCRNTFEVPRMLNSFCRREVALGVRQAAGRLFLFSPDYSFPMLFLTAVREWTFIDEPLRLQGVFSEGIGASSAFNRGAAHQTFFREFGKKTFFETVPLKMTTVTNSIADTLLLSKALLLPKLADFHLDWEQYFLGCWNDLLLYEENGVNVEAEKREYLDVLSRQPAEIALPVQARIKSARQRMVRLAREYAMRSRWLLRWALRVHSQCRVIWGKDARFENIFECAKLVPELTR